MKFLSQLAPHPGSLKRKKRLGKGEGSGHGGSSTKGHKGQKSRAGGYHKRGFEGGQMSLIRRVPKQGFTNVFKKEIAIVNLDRLGTLAANTKVDEALLRGKGWVKGACDGIKVLGNGNLKVKLTLVVHAISAAAKKKIEGAGGTVELIKGQKAAV